MLCLRIPRLGASDSPSTPPGTGPRRHRGTRFRSSASRRPSSIGETRGFIKYVAERDTHRLLGCHVVGYQGADLVYDAVVVTRAEGLIDDLALAVGVFPTLQEGMEGVARAVLRKAAPEEVSGPLVTAVHEGMRGGGGI